MNGAHDMGGVHGFGAVEIEPNEPYFHAGWERRALALTLAMGATGAWNLDMSRHAREARAPDDYLSKTYYEIWLAGLERLLMEAGLVTAEEIAAGRALEPALPVKRTLAAADVPAVLAKGGPTLRESRQPARFKPGDAVVACNMHPLGHTRLPRYARARRGEIALVHGCHIFPDSHAHGKGEDPRWLYSVRFPARELWGEDGDARSVVHIDLWEPYLEPA